MSVGCRAYLDVLIDSGCTHNIVDEHTWAALKQNAIKCRSSVNPTGKQLYTYASNQPLTIKGTFGCNVQAGNNIAPAEFFVIKGKGIPLVGKDTAMTLGCLKSGLTLLRLPKGQKYSSSYILPCSAVWVN